jgi:membrane protease subunit HflK
LSDLLDTFKKYAKKTKGFGSGGGKGFSPTLSVGVVGTIIFGFWLVSGFYINETDQQGVVLRFGKFDRISMPGLNYKFPFPVEKVYSPRVDKINIINSGIATVSSKLGLDSTDDRVMLTGDENIVNIEFTIQWKIKDPKDFVLNSRSPELTLKISGQTPILQIVSGSGWSEINTKAQTLLQNLVDDYRLGIQVINIKLQKAFPPEAVNEAFQDVQNARTDKARISNEAESYRNDILPRARAEAISITQEAQGYKEALIAQAQGEAKRFGAVLEEYEKNPAVVLKRMQLQNMEKVLGKNPKVLVDEKIGKNLLQVLPGITQNVPNTAEPAKSKWKD